MSNRAKLLAEILRHLEQMDGEELHEKMQPPKAVGVEVTELKPMDQDENKEKGPMEELMEAKEPENKQDEEPNDEELEELFKNFSK